MIAYLKNLVWVMACIKRIKDGYVKIVKIIIRVYHCLVLEECFWYIFYVGLR